MNLNTVTGLRPIIMIKVYTLICASIFYPD